MSQRPTASSAADSTFSARASCWGPRRWNVDPKTRAEAPLTFGKSLDYRDPEQVGDIKYLWELNRHLHLVTLAQAHALSGDARYFAVIRAHLQSWIAACPFRSGPNWSSALEAAIRLINWSVAWQLLGGAHSPVFADAEGLALQGVVAGIRVSPRGVHPRIFFHALLGEQPPRRRSRGAVPRRLDVAALADRRRLARRSPGRSSSARPCCRTPRTGSIASRPSPISNSGSIFSCSRCWPGARTRRRFPAAFESRVAAMIADLASILDAGGSVPMIGDSDDALVVCLDPTGNGGPYRSQLAAGALLFRRPDFKAKALAARRQDALAVRRRGRCRVSGAGGGCIPVSGAQGVSRWGLLHPRLRLRHRRGDPPGRGCRSPGLPRDRRPWPRRRARVHLVGRGRSS